MFSFDIEQTCLLELIKASLFKYTPEFSDLANWEKVFELAKAQCIVPLLASCVPKVHRNEWLAISCQSKAHFMKMLYEQNSLIRLLKDKSIPFVIFKGTAAAIYYPTPSLRTYGDIDLYVSEEFFESAKNVFENNGYLFTEENYRHYSFYKNGFEVELHHRISSQSYNYIDSIFFNGLNNAVERRVLDNSFPCLPTYVNGLVLLGHIMQHLKSSGIGLRQIIDWMMFVHKELDDTAWADQFFPLAREAGLEKLAITVTYICKKWLGLPNDISWCDVAEQEVAEQLFIRILDDGNFGKYRDPSENIKNYIKDEGLFKYLQRVGIDNWSLAKRYAFFRAFAWLYQMCRYAGKGIASLFTEKKVLNDNKYDMSLEELWERLE